MLQPVTLPVETQVPKRELPALTARWSAAGTNSSAMSSWTDAKPHQLYRPRITCSGRCFEQHMNGKAERHQEWFIN